MNRRWVLCAAFIVVGYCGAYLWVRSERYLIHRSGYAHGNTDNHSIAVGDLWTPLGGGPMLIASASYWFFTPLRWAETGYWYLRHPTSKPWPYFQGNKPPPPAG